MPYRAAGDCVVIRHQSPRIPSGDRDVTDIAAIWSAGLAIVCYAMAEYIAGAIATIAAALFAITWGIQK